MKKVFLVYCLVLLMGLILNTKPAPLSAATQIEQQSNHQRNAQSVEEGKRGEAKKEDLVRRYEQIRRNEESKKFDEAIRRSRQAGKHQEVKKYEEAKRKWESKNVKKAPDKNEERSKYAKTTKQDPSARSNK